MIIGLSDVTLPVEAKSEWFLVEASQAIDLLRNRISDVVSELGVFIKPAELHHALSLDRTLSRQVFKLSRSAEPMASGGLVPSEASLHRFLDAAKGRGITDEKIQGVVVAFKQFDEMVKKHAGDRVTFNSTVAGVEGVDEEWHAADLQHRRNGFRTMSHALGMQTKTRLQLFVISLADDANFQIAATTGWMGLRVLRPLASVGMNRVALDPVVGSIASA